jgi:hypothetical protein
MTHSGDQPDWLSSLSLFLSRWRHHPQGGNFAQANNEGNARASNPLNTASVELAKLAFDTTLVRTSCQSSHFTITLKELL